MHLSRPLIALLGTLVTAGLVAAQYPPVLPRYEGFIENGDGSHTLAFGYENRNRVTVEIPVGPDNSFTPFPQDRGQPIEFLPGRRRAVCVIVLPRGFEGSLQWTLSLADSATTETEVGGIEPAYRLERRDPSLARRVRELDAARAPRGRCLNRPPQVRAGADRTIRLPAVAFLDARVQDEGLPRRARVEVFWEQVEGPADVVLTDPQALTTRAVFSEPGSYGFQVTATDGELDATDTVAVEVLAPFVEENAGEP